MARDEYGNTINPANRTTKGSRRGTDTLLKRLAGKGIGYVPIFTGARKGVLSETQVHPYPSPPQTFTGTLPEWAILWAHNAIGLKQDIDFGYLSHIGGAGLIDSFSSAQIDFFEYDLGIGIEIQGLYWHYEFGGRAKVLQDVDRKARAESLGYQLIFIDEDNAIADPIYYLKQARQGIDRSRITRGI